MIVTQRYERGLSAVRSWCSSRAAALEVQPDQFSPPLFFQIAVLSRKKILPKIISVPAELISLPFFYGPVIIKKNVSVFHARVWNRNRKTVFLISVPTDSGFCLTSFISQCFLLSELVGWGEEAERTIIQCIFYLHPCCLLLVQLLSALLALRVPTMATDQQRHACGRLFYCFHFSFFSSSYWRTTLCTRHSLSNMKKQM